MRKKLLVIGATVVLAMTSITGCGKSNTTETSSEADATTESVTSEEVASDTEAEEVVEEVVEEDNTWFGENNITFTEGEVSAPCYSYTNEDGAIDENMDVTQMEVTYSEPVIETSEPDENNNVTYTVTYDVTGEWVATMPADVQNINTYYQFLNYNFIDAYTGTVFPSTDLTDDNGHEFVLESDVEVNGKTYHISIGKNSEQEWGEGNWTWLENNTKKELKASHSNHVTLIATVPADYDGLILALDGNGVTEYIDVDGTVTDAHPFEDNIATTIFKDVTYGKIVALKEGNMHLAYDGSQIESDKIYNVNLFNDYMNLNLYIQKEQEEIIKDGFVKIKWKDGTYTSVTGEIECDEPFEGMYSYCIYFSPIDLSQVDAVVIGDEELSEAEIREW